MVGMASLHSFEDILEPRRLEECFRSGISKDLVISTIKNILHEIGYNRKIPLIRWLGLVLAKICSQVCTGIHVNKHSILKLRDEMGDVPVMYVPSHRSYADFILMSYICFHYDIKIPAIAAGMDFHGMKGMGTVLRNTGAFFMRRSYNDDNLYWDTFREYVHQVVLKGDLGIEFFIEGTRSRSGKSLYPKFGLFSMILKAFFNAEVPDILFVPINISYERVMEEKLFAFELLGVPKPKESTSAFFKSLSLIKEKYGNVYVNFGTPISAYQFFADKIDRSEHSTKPVHMQTTTEKERRATSLLAESIVRHQQKLCVITTFNLIAIVIIENFIYKSGALTLANLQKELIWLKEIMEKFGAVTNFQGTLESILESFVVHRSLIALSDKGDIKLVNNASVVGNVDRTRLKGHQLPDKIMARSVPLITIQLYVNPTLHYFINPALITVILKKYSQNGEIPKDALFSEFSFLRSVFLKEFVLFSMYEEQEFEDSMKMLKEAYVIKDDGYVRLLGNEELQQLLYHLLQPFFITYYVVGTMLMNDLFLVRVIFFAFMVVSNAFVWMLLVKALQKSSSITAITISTATNYLVSLEANECTEAHIYCATQALLEKWLIARKSIHPYTLSLDTISNCIQSLSDLKAIEKCKRNSSTVYTIQTEALSTIIKRLDEYVVSMIPRFRMPIVAKL